METIIRVSPSELNSHLLDKIKDFIGNRNNFDITISLQEYDPIYKNELDQSIEEIRINNDMISMTMDEFISYSPKKE